MAEEWVGDNREEERSKGAALSDTASHRDGGEGRALKLERMSAVLIEALDDIDELGRAAKEFKCLPDVVVRHRGHGLREVEEDFRGVSMVLDGHKIGMLLHICYMIEETAVGEESSLSRSDVQMGISFQVHPERVGH